MNRVRSNHAGWQMHSKVGSLLVLASAALLLTVLGFSAQSADAAEGLTKFEMVPTNTQAGGHPDVYWNVSWKARSEGPEDPCHCDDGRVVTIHSPTGFIGNPHAVPTCTISEFTVGECPEEAQVGWGTILGLTFLASPIYNMETHPDQAGLIAFTVPFIGVPVFIDLGARTESDYGLDSTGAPVQHLLAIPNIEITLWGVPSLPVHDELRFKTPLSQQGLETGATSNAPPIPYLQNPTTCGVSLTASVDVEYYSGPTYHGEAPYPPTTGCETLSFNPSLSALPTTTQADSASGVDIDLKVPQTLNALTPSPSELRSAKVTLPPGFSINPNAADGKVACSDADSGIGTRHGATCPEFSKVGTVSLDSSALPGPIPGAIYLGEPKLGDRYRLILAADGFGTHIKLVGSIHPDPATGQVVTSFSDLPQSPLTEFSMHFFGSERGFLATPPQCGAYTVESEFGPWDSQLPSQSSTSIFTIDSGPLGQMCPSAARPFNPQLQAGTASLAAGKHAPFILVLNRADGDQNLTGLNVSPPPGLLATLKGIPYCPQSALDQLSSDGYSGLAEQVSPACPAASQIGTATAAAGAGSHPVTVSGKVYLAGPYKGDPLSLVIVIPAVSGPYDLGAVAVRAAIHVDPVTTRVTAESDPLPQILDGIPLRTRSILVALNRPNFTLNPTNCEPLSVGARIAGDEGAVSNLTQPFQAANCASLPFAPKLALKLTGSTKQAGNPALTATLTARPGEANISRTQVTLPPTELVDNSHINNLCTRVQFNEGKTPGEKCPSGSILGFAKADTPLLEKPLEGPIFLRATGRAGLPDVVAALNGQIDVVLDGHVDSVHGRLRTTFETVPDAPITKVVLSFNGGHKGLIENSPKLCAHVQHFTAAMTGQNGKTANRSPVLSTPCGKTHKRKARAHHNRRAHR